MSIPTAVSCSAAGSQLEAIAWTDLVVGEPLLAELEAEVRAVRPYDDGRFCANAVWYGYAGWPGIKPRYLRLVGWDRGAKEAEPTGWGLVDIEELLAGDDYDADQEALRQADKQAGRAFLWSSEAYDVGYHHLYELLPACRVCGCM